MSVTSTRVFSIFQYIIATLLIAQYFATLIRVLNGSKFTQVIKLLIILIFSNFALIVGVFAFNKAQDLEESNKTCTDFCKFGLYAWYLLQSISIFIRDACFNCAHWIFAYDYYLIAHIMPFAIKR